MENRYEKFSREGLENEIFNRDRMMTKDALVAWGSFLGGFGLGLLLHGGGEIIWH